MYIHKQPTGAYHFNPKLTGEAKAARIREAEAFIAKLAAKHGVDPYGKA